MNYDVYNDINARTNGEIYMGVVGPVRTGKSTFIKQFMDLLVIPNIQEENNRQRAIDELPQSANGKIIMTTEPKFIPKEAVDIEIDNTVKMKVRLIDCVGYMVDGALGHEENDKERMVKTPWYDYEIPFVKAAEIGTKKVINDHSTIGIVVTTDGSVGEIPRESYIDAEKKTIGEMKAINKPFVVVLNSTKPYAAETVKLAKEIEEEYGVKVVPVSCLNLKRIDIENILKEIVEMFPIERIEFNLPKWIETLEDSHNIKQDIIIRVKKILDYINTINDAKKCNILDVIYDGGEESQQKTLDETDNFKNDTNYIESVKLDTIDMQTGVVKICFNIHEKYYYQMLTELTGVDIDSEYGLIETLKYLSQKKIEFEKVSSAYNEVKNNGYGIVTPDIKEITLKEPELVKHGNKFGIKLKAVAPSMHMLKADITTEIAPIVGSEDQAKDLITYLQSNTMENPEGIWDINIFGKSIRQLVEDGIRDKVNNMSTETREKMQETLSKLLNDSKGGVICIII